MSKLPSIGEISRQCKRRKVETATLVSSYETISSLDLSSSSSSTISKLSREVVESWLVCKFGLVLVNEVCGFLKTIPETATEGQRKQLLGGLTSPGVQQDTVGKLANFIDCHCSHLLQAVPKQSPLVLSPPTRICFDCDRPLVSNHQCHVKCYSLNGCATGTKFTLRCKACNISYNYAHFGNKSENGFRFYQRPQAYIEVTDTVYFSRELLEWQCSLANHSWVSFQGFSESFNTALAIPCDKELTPHIVGEAFYNGELESELRRIDKVDYRFFKDNEREKCMEMVEEMRRQCVYPHKPDTCTAECKKRGCGSLWVTDGIWKTVFPHCMFKVEQMVQGIPALNLPDVCTNSPERGKAFCTEHCLLLKRDAPNVPLELKEFLIFCGAQPSDTEDGENMADTNKVDEVVRSIDVNTSGLGQSAANSQGTATLLEKHPELVQRAVYADPAVAVCLKDTGAGNRLRKWSRGHHFVVRGGGHIDTWQPLYRSESPSQVFFILIQWLLSLGETGAKMTLAYDNMCNLAKMKIAQAPLPFASPLDRLWLDIDKIIDVFHFRNHVSPDCKQKFSPAKLKSENPDFNTQAGEQTFVWVHRFSHILCSMNKVHHLFYLHRMVLRRNKYTSQCYLKGKKPILPKTSKSDISYKKR